MDISQFVASYGVFILAMCAASIFGGLSPAFRAPADAKLAPHHPT